MSMLSSTFLTSPDMDNLPNIPKLESRKSTGTENWHYRNSTKSDQAFTYTEVLVSANSRFDEAYTPPSQRPQTSRSTSRATESSIYAYSDRQSSQPSSRSRNSSSLATSTSVGKKKGRFLTGLLSSKEPSMAAFTQMEARMKASQSKDPNNRLNPVGMPGVSSATLPDFVPKVNSKWDGVPYAVKQREKEFAKQGKHSDDYSSTSSPNRSRRASRSSSKPDRLPKSNSTVVSRDSQDQSTSSGISSIVDFEIINSSKEMARRPFSLRAPSCDSLPDVSSLLPKGIPPPPAIPDKFKKHPHKFESHQAAPEPLVASGSSHGVRGSEENADRPLVSAAALTKSEQFGSTASQPMEPKSASTSFPFSPQDITENSRLSESKLLLSSVQESPKDVPEHSYSPLPTPTDSFPPTPHSMAHPTIDEAEAFLVSGTGFIPVPPIPLRSAARERQTNSSHTEALLPSPRHPPSPPQYESHGFLAGEARPFELPPVNETPDSSRVANTTPQRRSSQYQAEAPVLSEELRVTQNDVECRPDSSRKRLGLTPTFTKVTETVPWSDAESTLERPNTPKTPSRFSFIGRTKVDLA